MTETVAPKKRLLRWTRKKKRSSDGSMSLVEHLQELRRRVIYAVLALIIGTILGYIWYQIEINTPWFKIHSLGDILRGPYCSLPPESRADFSFDGECRLLATDPFEMFLLRLKVGGLAGIVLSSPVWLYQIWAFITPGLHKNERRSTFTFVSIAVTFFVAGAVLAYYIIDVGLAFLMTIGDEFQAAALTGEKYFNFVLALLLIFGVSFEIPLIISMLNVVGLLTYDSIKDKRRMIIMILFIFAAIMTPGQEPYSMIILALALTILVELALQFCRWNDSRRKKQRPDWLDEDDNTASQLDYNSKPFPSDESTNQVEVQQRGTSQSSPQRMTESFGGGANFNDVL